MTHTSHTHELSRTKEFDLIFVEESALPQIRSAFQSTPSSAPTTTVSSFDPESLQQFHEEFKNLVLDSNRAYLEREESGWEQLCLQEPIEPHEIEWLDWETPTEPSLTTATARPQETASHMTNVPPAPIPTAPQQAIKLLTGPPLGTPPPVELWVVKAIGLLVALNVLFAGLIVSDSHLDNLLKWLRF